VTVPESAVAGAVEACLEASGAPWRRVADGEWGLAAQAAGWPLHVGLALRGGLLRAQAEVLGEAVADAAAVLHRNRRLVLVRFAASAAGAIWIQGELPASSAAHAEEVDRLLGLLIAAADELRAPYAARRRD
jgi:hypothetical protein